MIVGMGDENTLLLCYTEEDLATLRRGETVNFLGKQMLIRNIVTCYAKDKESLIALLDEAKVPFSQELKDKYRRGERTDNPPKVS